MSTTHSDHADEQTRPGEPTPGEPTPGRWRSLLVAAALGFAVCSLAVRLVQLQLLAAADLERLATRQSTIREVAPAKPGDIVDRHGRLLATSITTRSVFVVPAKLESAWETAGQLAGALNLDQKKLFDEISDRAQSQFMWVKRRCSDEEAERVRALGLRAECWGIRDEHLRRYPQGTLAAHVLGLRDIDGVGRGGIEEACDTQLKGVDGQRRLLLDSRGRVIDIAEDEFPAIDGRTVHLAIDSVVQVHVERALDAAMETWRPLSVCAIVADPNSGEVLAMASRPTFDPNSPESIPDDAWRNRTISDIYEPGSTLKPLIVAWALQTGLARIDESFDCEWGEYRMGKRVLHDHHRYGVLSLTDVLVKSSNIGMAKIGERLGNEQLHRALKTLGFGSPTGIELPGELAGVVRPLEKWTSYSTGSVPMGHEVSASPLQTLAAYFPLCNGGRMVSPHLVLAEPHGAGGASQVIASDALDPDVADWVRMNPLTAVVERGTGRQARLAGYTIFGKTGTAQKLDPATGQYSHDRHMGSFLCGGPVDDPRAIVIVCVDEPTAGSGERFGGRVAAPTAAAILQATLRHLRVPESAPVAR
jgi:cell division protein FtsI/penicillin-binding protein 2